MNTSTINAKAIEQTLQRALAAQGTGKLDVAYKLYLQVIQSNPEHGLANHNLGILDIQAGRTDGALARFQAALQSQPMEAQFWVSYIKALMVAGDLDRARQSLVLGQQQGLGGSPIDALAAQLDVRKDVPSEQCNGVMALIQGGYLLQAETLARSLVANHANLPTVWRSLAAVLRSQSKHTEALAALVKAKALAPHANDVFCNIGVTYLDLQQFDNAINVLEQVIALSPGLADAHYFLGNAYANVKRGHDAALAYGRAIELNPQLFEARFNLANVQKNAGENARSEATLLQLLQLAPNYAEARHELALAYQRQGKLEAAAKEAGRAISINPGEPRFHNALAEMLGALGRHEEAERERTRALEVTLLHIVRLDPENPGGHANLGVFYMRNGQLDEAIAAYQRTIELQPDSAHANDGLMFAYAYDGRKDPGYYLQQARLWEQRVVPLDIRNAAKLKTFKRDNRQGRPLRIGYVSGDFKNHAIASFIETLFANHDKARVSLTAYSSVITEDEVSERIAAHCTHWERIAGVDDAIVVDRINDSAIDVLIDLSGYTGLNRMQAFAYRAAPVQTHYLGYFASTGLTEMDYWIADEDVVPPAHDTQFSETVWRLPRVYCCYQGREDAPAVSRSVEGAGQLCLASFNGIAKLTDATLALWAKILHALPDAKLLLKHSAFAEDVNRQRVAGELLRHGISLSRIEFKGNIQDWAAHMDLYNHVDITLDPIGAHAGVTTTCDALWMGVPVISKNGDRMAQRQGASILTALGHPEWIADTNEEYIQKVLQLANDADLRKSLRQGQREKMHASSLCDARAMAAALEDAYEAMFDLWWAKSTR